MFDLKDFFQGKGAQLKVAEYMMRKGVRVSVDGVVSMGEVEIKKTSLADVLEVDRRVVNSTVQTILESEKLSSIYSRLECTVFLRDAAAELEFGVFEVIPEDAARPGIVAGVTQVLDKNGIGIRQIIADDPMFQTPELTVITESPIERSLLDGLLAVDGVEKIIILN